MKRSRDVLLLNRRMTNPDRVFSTAPEGLYMVAGYCGDCLVDYSALIRYGRDGEVRKLINETDWDITKGEEYDGESWWVKVIKRLLSIWTRR